MFPNKLRNRIILSTIIALCSTQTWSKGTYSKSLKHHDAPSRGCLPVSRVSLTEAEDAMEAQNLVTEGATNLEKRTLGAGLIWMHYLNGGNPLSTGFWKGVGSYKIKVVNGNGSSGQRWDHIIIRRNGSSKHGESVAQHVHELGHLIGNNGAYNSYRRYMKGYGYCKVSGYSDDKFNEQFAEVFAGFVTDPAVVLENTSTPKACKRAFDFFENWFDAGNRIQECL